MENINYSLTKCYKSREINTNEKPLFKLNAFCINLERREKNMEFINKEWKDYCNIKRFNALNNATASHIALLKYIYSNKTWFWIDLTIGLLMIGYGIYFIIF